MTGRGRTSALQAVILAGGLATRLRPTTERVPKAMLPVAGQPFLYHQLRLMVGAGVTEIVLCVGHLGDQIMDYFGDGHAFGVKICYSKEGERLLGTAGALKKAERLLADRFFVTYGDSFLRIDYQEVMRYFDNRTHLGLMVVYRNCNQWDRSNVITEGALVKVYDKKVQSPAMAYIDYGLSVLRREALSVVASDEVMGLDELYQDLIRREQLLAFEAHERFYEIGSPDGLAEFRRLLATGDVL